MEKANVLVLGTSGAGKSTLINTIIGEPVAPVGNVKRGTTKMSHYESEDLNFNLIDSRGFEYDHWFTMNSIKEMKGWLKDGLKDNRPRIHMLWLCVDATSKRFSKQTIKAMEHVKKEFPNVPIIVVLTKAFFSAEDEDNKRMVEDTFERFAKKTGMPIAIIPVLAEPPKGEEIAPRGIEELVEVTVNNLDEGVRASEEAVAKFALKTKRIQSQAVTAAATASAATVGAVPVPVPDSAILVPIETGMVNCIAKIYGYNPKGKEMTNVISTIIEAGVATIAAKGVLGLIGKIPGINIVGAPLNALVAGVIVLSIGEATSAVMEGIHTGKIDSKDVEKIRGVMNEHVEKILAVIVPIIKNSNGKINIGELVSAVFDKKSIGKKPQ